MTLLLELLGDRRLLAAVGGAIGVAVGAFLPWALVATPVGDVVERGVETSGKIALALALVGLGLLVAHAHLRHRDLAIAAGLAALACAGIGIAYLLDLDAAGLRLAARARVPAAFIARGASGVWVAIVSAGVATVASAALALAPRRDPEEEPAGDAVP